MFWKIFELLIRVVFFRRFRAAKRIGEAGRLLSDGRPKEALALLERVGERLHQSLLPVYAFTRGKILDALGQSREAAQSFRLVVLADPASARADLELAILAGREGDLEGCRRWLERARAKNDAAVTERMETIDELLRSCESGERAVELERRARAFAKKPLSPDGEAAGWPPDLAAIERFIRLEPDAARENFDEIAILVGQAAVAGGGRWSLCLALDGCTVDLADGTHLDPFAAVAAVLDHGATLQTAGRDHPRQEPIEADPLDG